MTKNIKHPLTKKHMTNNQKKPLLGVETEVSLVQKVGLVLGMICAFLVGIVWTAVLLTPILPTAPKTISPEQAWNDFKINYGQNWQIEWKNATKTPERLIGGSIGVSKINSNITTVNKDNVDSIARQFLKNNQTLFKVNDADLKVSQIYDDPSVEEEASQRIVTIHYLQYLQNLPVFKSHLGITFKNNNLIIYDANYFPNLTLSTIIPAVTQDQALESAKMAEINKLYPPDQSPYLNQNFDPSLKKTSDKNNTDMEIPDVNPDDLKLDKSSLLIYPIESKTQINFTLAYKLDFHLIEKPYISTPTYYIDSLNNKNPFLERVENIRFANLDGTVTGLEYPYYPPCEFGQTPCSQAGSQVSQFQDEEVIAGGKSANTNTSGYYLISGLSGTVNLTSGLSGSYVDVNNLAQADASHTANVTVPATHNWDWQSGGDNSYKKEESNVFYHVNKIHDYFTKGSPFDIDLSITANVQKPDCGCNGYAGTYTISLTKAIDDLCEATSLGSDVIYHEYTHIVTMDIHYLGSLGESGAMNEGYSDYFALTNVNRSTIGDGIWQVPIRDINNTKRYPDDIIGEVHIDSLPFSGALWDLREYLGATTTDAMVITTEKSGPEQFREFLENIISLYPSYINQICDAFYSNHGIYSNLCINHTTTSPIAYIGSPSNLAEISKNPTSLNIIGTAVKSIGHTFQNFKIEYASVNTPDTWLNTGVTLTGNGLVEVSENTLGSIDLTNLFGNYRIKLTVKDSIAEQKYYTTVNIGARTGFPVTAYENVGDPDWYISPATVAELDGNTSNGLEIIANSYSSTTSRANAWNKDGGLIWQKSGGQYPFSHSAVADINLDGNSEIIILNCSNLIVFDKNGDIVSPWPLTVPKNSSNPQCHYGTPVVANLDGNTSNGLEIIFGADDGKVYAYRYNKTPVTGWPKLTSASYRILSTPAVADLDPLNSNGLEVVATSSDNKVYFWKADGSNFISPKSTSHPIYSSPAIANLDNNLLNGFEIVVSSGDDLYAWSANGNQLFLKNYLDYFGLFSPVIGNIDNNPSNGLEIAVQGAITLHVVNASGEPLANWPKSVSNVGYCSNNDSIRRMYGNSPSVVDIDGDGRREILVSNICDQYPAKSRIYAFNVDGTSAAGFPLILNDSNSNTYTYTGIPDVFDLDNNGKLELIFTGINNYSAAVHVFDLPWSYNLNYIDAPTFHFDNQRTGKHSKLCSDGTLYGQCNANHQYCDNGNLVENCSKCGCASGCCEKTTNQCSSTCIDGTSLRQCSVNKPKYCGFSDEIFCNLFDACPICGCPEIYDINGNPKYICESQKGSGAGECVLNPNYCVLNKVLYLPFNEGSDTTTNDLTCYHNNGQLGDGMCTPGNGSCPSWVSGYGGTGYALSFDGNDDRVEVADTNSLDLKDGFNIRAWVKFTGSLNHQFGTIIKKEGAYMLRFYRTNNTKLQGVVYKENGEVVSFVAPKISWANNQWYHIAFTYDKHNLKLFIDNVESASTSLSVNIRQSGHSLGIGNGWSLGYGWNGDEEFPGVIDEVKIYNKATDPELPAPVQL